METKFTPGPWHHYSGKLRPQFGGVIHEVQTSDGTAIIKWGGFDGVDYPKQVRANADLISAAPDLYSATADLLGAVRELAVVPGMLDNDPAVLKARAALAKARGES